MVTVLRVSCSPWHFDNARLEIQVPLHGLVHGAPSSKESMGNWKCADARLVMETCASLNVPGGCGLPKDNAGELVGLSSRILRGREKALLRKCKAMQGLRHRDEFGGRSLLLGGIKRLIRLQEWNRVPSCRLNDPVRLQWGSRGLVPSSLRSRRRPLSVVYTGGVLAFEGTTPRLALVTGNQEGLISRLGTKTRIFGSREWRPKRGSIIKTHMTKRRHWNGEPLVKGRVTRKAMLGIKGLRSLKDHNEDEIFEVLQRWVVSMRPGRRDWIDVFQEFDNKEERKLVLKMFEFAFQERWFDVNERDCSKMIDRYGKENRTADAEHVLRDMKGCGFTPDVAMYTAMIGALGQAGMTERARQVFEQIRLMGLQPDAITYSAMMIVYGYAGMPHEAEALLTDMEADRVTVNADNYIVLITAYGRLCQSKDAQRIFDLMLDKGIQGTQKAFTALLHAYGRAGDPETAKAVFDSLRAAGFTPDDRAISTLIGAYEKANIIDKAVRVVVDLENVGIKPGLNTLTALIGWFGKVGLVDEAKEVFDEMIQRRLMLTFKTYANMYAAYAHAGNLEMARGVWSLMEEKGVVMNEVGYNIMVKGLVAGQLLSEAGKFYDKMQERGWELSQEIKSSLLEAQEAVC